MLLKEVWNNMVPISSATRDSTKTATTSGRCMARCAYRKYKRVKMNCMASSATRRLSGFGEQFTLIQPTDDTSELRKNEKDNGNRFSSVPLSDPHRVNGYQHRSHGQGQEWVQNPSGDPQAEGGISTSTLANHRLQPWSSNPRHISAILLRTTSLTRLENILDQHAPFLNARHISIALSILPDIADGSRRVASTSSTYEEGLDEPKQNGLQSSAHARAKRVRVLSLLSRLTVAFGRYLSEYEPRDFAAASRSLGKIECSPPGADGGKRWMENLLSASLQGQGLKRFQSRELSTFLWGLAKIKLSKTYGDSCLPSFGVGVGLELMTRAKERALEIASATEDALTASPLGWEGLGGSIATPQGLSVILWSLVNLCMGTSDTCLPSGAELDPEETDVEAASNQRGLSSLLPASWIDEYLSVLSKPAIIKSLDTKNVCMSLGALARCSSGSSSYRPPPLLVHRLLHRLLSQCSATPTADERQWVILQCRRVLAESTPKAAQREGFTDDPRCIVEALWSLAKLGFRPGKDVMSRLCHTSQAFLAGGKMSGRESVILLWSMAVLRAEVDDTWLREYERATMRLIQSDFTAQGLSCSVWAMSKLGFRPGFAWMDAVMTASQEKMSDLGPHSLSLLASSLVTLKYTPRPSWTLALITAATRALPEASPLSLTLIAYSVANLAGSFFGKNGKTSPTLSSPTVFLTPSQKAACAAFVDALVTHSGRLLRHQQRESSLSSFRLHARELSLLLWSVSKISHSANGPRSLTAIVSPSWLHAASHVSSYVMPTANARDVSQILFALARMSLFNKHEITPLVESAVSRLSWIARHEPQEMKLQDISNALWSLATLRVWPQDRSSTAQSSLDPDLVALLSAANDSVQQSSFSNLCDAELSQVTWSLVRMTAHEPSSLLHPKVSSLASSLITASRSLFDSATQKGAEQEQLSMLSTWTLISGLSRLACLSNSLASDRSRDETPPSHPSLVLSREWIRAATDAAAVVVSSPRSRNTPPRLQRKIHEGILHELQQLGALPEGEGGIMVWQDLIKTDSSPSSGEWDEPFLRGPLTPWTSSAEGLAFSEESSSPITRPISFGEQLPVTAASGKRLLSSSRYREAIRVATTTDNDDSDEEHRW